MLSSLNRLWLWAIATTVVFIFTTHNFSQRIDKLQQFDKAVDACLLNDAYIGINQEDTRHLFVQCIADWEESH